VRSPELRGVHARLCVRILLRPQIADIMAFWSVILSSTSVGCFDTLSANIVFTYPGDNLNVVRAIRHLENVPHSIWKRQVTGAIDICPIGVLVLMGA
jgi:hypothetical protein